MTPPPSARTAGGCEGRASIAIALAVLRLRLFQKHVAGLPQLQVRRAQLLHVIVKRHRHHRLLGTVLVTCDVRPRSKVRAEALGIFLIVRLRYRVMHRWKEGSALFTTVYHRISGYSTETYYIRRSNACSFVAL